MSTNSIIMTDYVGVLNLLIDSSNDWFCIIHDKFNQQVNFQLYLIWVQTVDAFTDDQLSVLLACSWCIVNYLIKKELRLN